MIALVRLVLLVRLASEVWKSILSRERKSFQARTCCGPVSSGAALATRSRNLATAGRTCTGTYLIVVKSCVVSCTFHFVEFPKFRFLGYHQRQNNYRYRSEIKSKTIGLYQITDVTDLY